MAIQKENENNIKTRVSDPNLFVDKSFRTFVLSASKGIKMVAGKYKTEPSGSLVKQSYLFDKNKWSATEATKWVEDNHDKSFVPIDIEGKKIFELSDMKAYEDDKGDLFIEGYANVKNVPDRYGDIPSVFTTSP